MPFLPKKFSTYIDGNNTIGAIKKRYLNNSPGPRDLGRTALKEVIEKINEMEMDIESS